MNQVLLGSLLGDGCVTKNNAACVNYCFKELHGPEQREYVEWKGKMLSEFGTICCGQKKPELFTKTTTYFTQLRKDIYGDKKEKNRLPQKYFKHCNHLGLLVWYLDDGTWQQGQLCIRCELFNTEDLRWLVDYLNSKMGLSLKIYEYDYARMVAFRKVSRDKVLPIWKRLFSRFQIPSSMKYKLTGEK